MKVETRLGHLVMQYAMLTIQILTFFEYLCHNAGYFSGFVSSMSTYSAETKWLFFCTDERSWP